MGLHARNAYLTGLALRRTLTDFAAVGLFQNDQGYLADSGEQLIIAFAGPREPDLAEGLAEWRDASAAQLDVHSAGRVHLGCQRQLRFSIREDMHRGLEKLYTGQSILLTGHSRGGALATLAAHELHYSGISQVSAFTFGAPRVGDVAFAESCQFPIYRVECAGDPVPQLPAVEGYSAAGECIWLGDDGGIHVSPGAASEQTSPGAEETQSTDPGSFTPDWPVKHAISWYVERLENGRPIADE
jgi:hypothetical protein